MVKCYKTRLEGKGFSQEYGIDYDETFAPIVRLTLVQSLLPIAVIKQWPLLEMDVKNVFLNGYLMRKYIWSHLLGIEFTSNKICCSCKALYGLK